MSLVPTPVSGGANSFYFALANAPTGIQTLDLSGNTLSISDGNSVNLAAATLVSTSAVKLTAQSYIAGFNSTQFSGQVVANGNIESAPELGAGSAVLNGGDAEVAIGGTLSQPPHVRFELAPSQDAVIGYNGEQLYMAPMPEFVRPYTLYFDPASSTITYGLATGGAVGPTGPQGVQGIQGPQGVAGPTGAQGIQGEQGVQGVPGDVGATGPAGPQGPQGEQGIQGVAGPTGAVGPQGPQGDQGIQGVQGATGAQGIQGPQGPEGPQGVAGPTGPQGAQGIQGDQGIQGEVGPTGLQGPQGAQGVQGNQGDVGPTGPAGAQGPQGEQGIQGVAGPTGAAGPQGPQGVKGDQGDIGPTGPEGPAGADGGSSTLYNYQADTNTQAPPVTNGYIEWNNAVQTSATELYVSHLTAIGDDIDVFLSLLKTGDALIIQDQNNSANNQKWTISAAPTVIENQYTTIPVSLTSSTHLFANNDQILLIVVATGAIGPTGPQGPQGPQGVAGPTGLQGPQGAQGEQGLQGEAGPTGPAGAQGPQGEQGIQGVAGATGPAGIQGPQGVKGDQGDIGPTGPQGLQGPQGEQGVQGVAGPTGPAGAQGPQGEQGVQGVAGPTGPVGPQGAQGDQGIQGVEGPTGPAGPQGPQGVKGDQGDVGPTGPQGIQGEQGIQGVAGPTGPQGVQGIQGPQGPQGDIGPTGATGPAGGSNTQILFNNGFGATGSDALRFYSSSNILEMAAVAGNIQLNPGNESINVSNNAGQYSQMGTGGISTGDGGSVSVTLDGLTPSFTMATAGSNAYSLDCSQDPPSAAFVGSNGSSLQTPYGLGVSYGSNIVSVDAVSPFVQVTNGVFTATMNEAQVQLLDGATTAATLSAGVLDLTDGTNNVNMSAVIPHVSVISPSANTAVLPGSVTVSIPAPTQPDELTRKDYVDAAVGFRPANMYYVATNGDDANDGSFLRPWLTVQHAIDEIEAVPPTAATQAIINLAPGHYVENLTFTTGYIAVVSPFNANDLNEVAEITGSVTVNITTGADDLFNKQVMFQGVQITGGVVDTSSKQHTLMLQDCYLFGSGRLLYQNSSVDCRTRFYNSEVNSSSPASTDACIEINRGDAYLERLDCTYNGLAPTLLVGGTGSVFANNCDFTNTSASTASPGIKVVSITSTRASSFGVCLFRLSNPAAKTNANGFYGLFWAPASAPALGASILVVSSTFLLLGLPATSQCMASTGLGASITGGNNLALPTTPNNIGGIYAPCQPVGGLPSITVQAASGTIALTPDMNRSTYILTGTGTGITQTFTSAALAGQPAGWCVFLRNGNAPGPSTTINITINGTSQLFAATTGANAGEMLLYWNGTTIVKYG